MRWLLNVLHWPRFADEVVGHFTFSHQYHRHDVRVRSVRDLQRRGEQCRMCHRVAAVGGKQAMFGKKMDAKV